MRRVVVTGLGAVTAFGVGVRPLWEALASGRPGFAEIEGVDLERLRFRFGAQVRGWKGEEHFDPREATLLDAFAQYGAVAAREAIREAGI